MNVTVSDCQSVGEAEGALLTLANQGASILALASLRNLGPNKLNYRVQTFNGTAWVDADVSGTDYYNSITAGDTKLIKLAIANQTQARLVGNASGGALLQFTVSRQCVRASGARLPILAAA